MLVGFGAESLRAAEPAAGKPNVVFIICDDLGYADIGAYAQKKIKTPNVDRLAAEGMLFTQHYAGSPVCAPSRSCLMTGQHTGRTPIRANPRHARDWTRAQGDYPLPPDQVTLPKLFKRAGYAAAAIGKWGLGRPGTSGGPKEQGFDYFFGYADHTHAHDYYPDYLWRNDQRVELDGKQFSHDLMTEEALRFVREQKDGPFLLYLPYTIPHTKLQVPSVEPYENEPWPEPAKKLAAMITRMDRDVGRIMTLLAELKIDKNTLVIFTSDNGPWNIRGIPEELFDSNGPLRGHKRDVYEGGIRVPLIVRWPGKIAAGSKAEQVCANWDFLPSFAELLSEPKPAEIDGLSILPTLLGRGGEQKSHDYLYWEFNELGGQQAVRTGDWKGIRLDLAKNPMRP
ncbi:MAG TPA: arylsulfatase [Tepidisphaeraceae bacterium]|nr:arylsulfatase [Tepidisphaeraceae bacterium]